MLIIMYNFKCYYLYIIYVCKFLNLHNYIRYILGMYVYVGIGGIFREKLVRMPRTEHEYSLTYFYTPVSFS